MELGGLGIYIFTHFNHLSNEIGGLFRVSSHAIQIMSIIGSRGVFEVYDRLYVWPICMPIWLHYVESTQK